MAELPLDQAIPRFKTNEDRIDTFVNGDENATWRTADGTEVPSVRKMFKDINTEAARDLAQAAQAEAEAAQGLAETAQAGAEAAETGAQEAQTAAESARDVAFVNADVYADTTAGLAGTTSGEQFQVVSGDTIIRYTNSGGSAVEVARYPSKSGVDVVEARTLLVLTEQAAPFEFDRHSASSGIGYNSDGDWTVAAGAYGLWIKSAASMNAVAGGPLDMTIRVVSGTIKNPYIQQFNGGTNLKVNIPFELVDGLLVASTDALEATMTTLRLVLDNTGGGTVDAVINIPRYTVSGVPARTELGDQTLYAKNASSADTVTSIANRFREDWTASNYQGTGTSVYRDGDEIVIPPTRNAYVTSVVSGVDYTNDITVECRTDVPIPGVDIEFLFAGGSPSAYRVSLKNKGNYWYLTIPANTLTASPVTARFIPNNHRDATYNMWPVTDARVGAFNVKNAARASGHVSETWMDRKQSYKADDIQQQVLDDLNRRRLAMTSAKKAEAQSNPLHVAQANMAMMIAMQTATMWVDAVNGDDANSGATMLLPKQTWAAAYAATSAGDTIMLRNGEGQDYDTGAYVYGVDRSIFGWGDGSRRARIDIRQKLSGATWTNVSGNVWKAEVTHRDPLGSGRNITPGVDSNIYNFWLWFPGDVSWAYLAGSDTITDRINAVAAQAGSGFVHKTGSTNPEPRYESGSDAATDFTYYVHMPDGSNPNGQDIRIADRQGVCSWAAGGRLQNLDFIGNARKDNMSFPLSASATEDLRVVDNCRFLDCPEHAFIGLPLLRNYYYANGRPAPGTTMGALGRSLGSCSNFYTANLESLAVEIETGLMEVENFGIGVFGHGVNAGSGVTGGFKSLRIPCLVMRNCNTIAGFSQIANYQPYLRDGYTIDWVDAVNVGGGTGGVVNGGWIELEVRNDTLNQTMFSTSPFQECSLTDVVFKFGQQNPNYCWLVSNSVPDTAPGWSAPTITFNNCRDISPIDQKGHVQYFGATPYVARVGVVVKGNSKLGALISRNNNYVPESITIDAGSESGLYDEDRAGVIARMTAAGKTATIDIDARIVSHSGIVLSDLDK